MLEGDISNEELLGLSYFWDWIYYGNEYYNNAAFEMNYYLNADLRAVLDRIFMQDVFGRENFTTNNGQNIITTNSKMTVIPVEKQQQLTALEPQIKAYLEENKGLVTKDRALLISLQLNYYDGYSTDEKFTFRLYRFGGFE